MVFRLHYPGLPIAKQRPRLGKGGHIYTPAKTKAFETALAWAAKVEMRNAPMLEGHLCLSLIATLPSIARVDVDNLAKAALDGLQGVVFRNDAQIVRASIEKRQGESPGLDIEVAHLRDRQAARR